MAESVTNPQLSGAASPVNTVAAHRDSIVLVRWALTITCAYLVLFSEQSRGASGLAALVIVTFLASNLIIGRLPARTLTWPSFHITVAALDTVLIGLSLFCAGQLSAELIVLLLGVLVLAIGGIRLGVIAALTIGMAGLSLLMVSVNGSEPLRHSSMLLRVPFLLAAAVAYAWLAETGRHDPAEEKRAADVVGDMAHDLSHQFEMIERCQSAAAQGLVSVTQGLLAEIGQANIQMRAKTAGVQLPEVESRRAPAVARSAA
jgi:4-amino-4-deoxy-L-arabinose transferase-like glycosyltransferase